MSRVKSALLAATLLVGTAGLALAQQGPTYDPAQLPELKGKVAQYTLTPRGDVDGLILADGTEVHINPALSAELVFAVRPGDSVTIHGLKARAVPMVAAASVTNDATGATVAGRGGRFMRARTPMEAQGTIKAVLHEPRGEANGVLLDDGTVVRLPPAEATRLAAQLAVGQKLFVRGDGLTSLLGRLVLARQIGPDSTKLTDVARPRMHDGHGHRGMMERMGRGPMMERGPMGAPGGSDAAPRPPG
ncbi:hypothetical protein [Limobrevibacterium gyesilva]|uniref:FecR protein domain-containing protein n=1 Tax=Limobrevibacterium gyesilva TaxID=2991712 RepID=A0AA41YJ66_9PROT|nr:hypothetical protein [Limobrevibacterium gyesilva]MCW3474144.1 hypothetical protein [Limobrevibacterium gyesilva]